MTNLVTNEKEKHILNSR